MNNKKGEIAIGTVIFIILAVLVLALLAYGLATGTVPFFGSIENFGGGQVNVQQVVQSCQLACSTQSTFDYCGKLREVTFVKGEDSLQVTCDQLANPIARRFVDGKGNVVTGNVPASSLDKCNSILIEVCRTATKQAVDNHIQSNPSLANVPVPDENNDLGDEAGN